MPGIHDAHVHVLIAGLSRFSNANLGLEDVVPASEVAGKLRTAACRCQYAHAFDQYVHLALIGWDVFCRTQGYKALQKVSQS